jgi:hypothetical protein
MIRTLTWLALVAAGASAAAAAPADEQRWTPEELRMLHDYTRCVVEANPNQTARLLKLDYRTASYRRSLQNLAASTRHCSRVGGRLRMSRVLLAGSAAEALLPRALAGRPLDSAVALDPAKTPIQARDDGEYLGLCAVRSMPGPVAALLATAPGSEAEKRALAAVTPGLSPCLRAGAAATLNRPAVRALVALAAYRIVTQAGPAPEGS